MLKECEADPGAAEDSAKEKISKAKHILDELSAAIRDTKTESFTEKMRIESEFNIGLSKNLVPWIDDMEKQSQKPLEKPENFEHAREIERGAVVFAKEVRRANKLLGTLEAGVEQLPDRKMWAGQQLDEQKLRFKNIATVAATRVETTRDLLVNWNFFLETKGESNNLDDCIIVLTIPALHSILIHYKCVPFDRMNIAGFKLNQFPAQTSIWFFIFFR